MNASPLAAPCWCLGNLAAAWVTLATTTGGLAGEGRRASTREREQ